MTVDITNDLSDIKILPSSEAEEIIQNVKTILCTRRLTVPLDRPFGINPDIIDLPISWQNKLTAEIVKAVNEFEPRAKIQKVSYGGNPVDGELIIKARVVL